MIPFSLYDAEAHEVLCTPSLHFNVSSICRAYVIKAVHEFLLCSAQHVHVHQCARSCDPRTKILQVCYLGVVDKIFDKPPTENNQGGLCLVIMATRWLVLLSQSSDFKIFHSGWLE